MHTDVIAQLAGGIGLFLLGMMLMTEGLRLAAGHTLRDVLAKSTATTLRGLLSGAFITALVQASGAVTVATIGFVNAGLMQLKQAVTIIYGSNVGTTMTAWLVVAIGLEFDIEALALPMVALGMVLKLVGNQTKAALGEALAGFGVFFLGLNILQSTFGDMSAQVNLAEYAGDGWASRLIFVGIGFGLTFLMQSSSAAMALTLTAAAGGVVPLADAACIVIGANVGTTSTAVLATLGATANARRVAAAHVVFNLVTGVVAFLIMPWLLQGLLWGTQALGGDQDIAAILALFHTCFNILGILLLLPFTTPLVNALEKRFCSREDDQARPRYLDDTLVKTPVLAMHALLKELDRIGEHTQRMIISILSAEGRGNEQILLQEQESLQRLVVAVGEFGSHIQREHLPESLDHLLPEALRISRYYQEMGELALQLSRQQAELKAIEVQDLAKQVASYRSAVVDLVEAALGIQEIDADACTQALQGLQKEYQSLKSALLKAGVTEQVAVRQMVLHLDVLSDIRRMSEQAQKSASYRARVARYMREEIPVPVSEEETSSEKSPVVEEEKESQSTPEDLARKLAEHTEKT
ncbi:phosphate:Na+ symporter [Allopseudospirillum japonicum]|uniref:Phosphate:Na+ symporter n=1 Tax=Allopseudospirillum japonicum TaxID=64971 RepID=A0A1H6SCW9_9GAMM|nr:Na/Pi symporter [Allopseudospirillum japonicum]SEI63744.1 phosphate:Na+ symporter [Allopseudospirillum japonicum]